MQQGVLQPGEATEILLRIWVDGGRDSTAELLATAADRKLDAILVLRVQDGNDIFCSVSGAYAPSFFGLPLALLASLPRHANGPSESIPGHRSSLLASSSCRCSAIRPCTSVWSRRRVRFRHASPSSRHSSACCILGLTIFAAVMI